MIKNNQINRKGNNKILILIIVTILLIGIIAFGYFYWLPEKENQQQTVDCGNSDECFTNYVKTCAPAKAEISDQDITYIETIEGYTDNDCILTLTYTEAPLTNLVGKEMTCRVPKSNLDNFKNYLQGDMMKKSCQGTLIDLMNQMESE